MSVLVLRGLRITTTCKYVKFTESRWLSIKEDKASDVLLIEYPKGFKNKDLVSSRIKVIDPDIYLSDTDYLLAVNPIVDINGLKIKKLSPYEYHFNQFLIDGLNELMISYDCEGCTIFIPDRDKYNLYAYYDAISANPYLEIVDRSNLESLSNIYGLLIKTDNVKVRSDNNFIFSTKSSYERYLLRDIDIIKSFLDQVGSILNGYGMELIRYPLDSTAKIADRLIYRLTEYGAQVSHKTEYHPLKDEVQHRSTIEFEATFLNLIKFNDFRNRYQNLDLLSNFTEFYTKDKLGRRWIANIKWNQLPTDFNQDYTQDNQGNISVPFNISCEIYYYVVYDRMYRDIRCILVDVLPTAERLSVRSDKEGTQEPPGCVHSTEVIEEDDWLTIRNKS